MVLGLRSTWVRRRWRGLVRASSAWTEVGRVKQSEKTGSNGRESRRLRKLLRFRVPLQLSRTTLYNTDGFNKTKTHLRLQDQVGEQYTASGSTQQQVQQHRSCRGTVAEANTVEEASCRVSSPSRFKWRPC